MIHGLSFHHIDHFLIPSPWIHSFPFQTSNQPKTNEPIEQSRESTSTASRALRRSLCFAWLTTHANEPTSTNPREGNPRNPNRDGRTVPRRARDARPRAIDRGKRDMSANVLDFDKTS
jgi:hypothetical protein